LFGVAPELQWLAPDYQDGPNQPQSVNWLGATELDSHHAAAVCGERDGHHGVA